MRYMYVTSLLLVLLGFLAACGQADQPGAANPPPSSEPVPPTTEPTALPATAAPPAPPAPTASPISASTTTPTQAAAPTVQPAISQPATSRPLVTIATEQPTASLRTPGVITLADQGRTIQIAIGETFRLQLGTLHRWAVPITDEQVLERIVDPTAGADVQAVYRALAPGQTTLKAVGEPTCRDATPPCMLPTIQFTVTILVQS
jgi:hypothetical protein